MKATKKQIEQIEKALEKQVSLFNQASEIKTNEERLIHQIKVAGITGIIYGFYESEIELPKDNKWYFYYSTQFENYDRFFKSL